MKSFPSNDIRYPVNSFRFSKENSGFDITLNEIAKKHASSNPFMVELSDDNESGFHDFDSIHEI